MSFIERLLKKPHAKRSAVLIDIRADMIIGAYALFSKREKPTLLHVKKVSVSPHGGELLEKAVLRSLKELLQALLLEGAPVLMRVQGSGRADSIVVSLGSPWQRTMVRTVHIEKKEPFIFTKKILQETVEKPSASKKFLIDENVAGAILNGYETREPYGKRATHATVALLTSLIEEEMAKEVLTAVKDAYHFHEVALFAETVAHFEAVRMLFPHEKDALVLDASGQVTSIALIRKGIFVAEAHVPSAVTSHAWIGEVKSELATLAKNAPLPRSLFMLAKSEQAPHVRKALENAQLEKLSLSGVPPRIISFLPNHLAGLVRQEVPGADLEFLLMVLFLTGREETH